MVEAGGGDIVMLWDANATALGEFVPGSFFIAWQLSDRGCCRHIGKLE